MVRYRYGRSPDRVKALTEKRKRHEKKHQDGNPSAVFRIDK
nr:MAG TPA: hypothetical protein [Caudoviricetes sp.]